MKHATFGWSRGALTDPKTMIVGVAPCVHKAGLPLHPALFHARSWNALSAALTACHVDPTDVWFTNVAYNDMDFTGCDCQNKQTQLRYELELLKPRRVIALGLVAAAELSAIGDWVPTNQTWFHPGMVVRNTMSLADYVASCKSRWEALTR